MQSTDEAPTLSPQAKQLLSQHHYTGNMRELRSILLRAMLFRSKIIQRQEIAKALTPHSGEIGNDNISKLKKQLAEEILQKINSGDSDFWQAIYQLYSQKTITREAVLQVIEETRRQGAASMPKLARALKACDPADSSAEGRKEFYRFKNFLYKTIRIS